MKPIEKIRKQIETTDRTIIKSMHERLLLAKKIGELKQKSQQKVTDKKRELKLLALHTKWAKKNKIDPKLVKTVFSSIMKESKKVQRTLKKNHFTKN